MPRGEAESSKKNLDVIKTEKEAREKGKAGGKKSGEVRRAKRTARETAKLFLEMAATEVLDENLKKVGVAAEDRTNQMGIVARLTLKAQSGDVQAARLLWELCEEMPKNSGENNFSVNIGKEDEERTVIILPPIEA